MAASSLNFVSPVSAASTANIAGTFSAGSISTVGSFVQPTTGTITNGTYTSVSLTGGTGTGAIATIVIQNSLVTLITVTTPGLGYLIGDVLSFSGSGYGTNGTATVTTISTNGPNDSITSTSGSTLTIDGVTPTVNTRVLLKNQTAGLQNGIYSLSQVAAAGLIATTGTIVQPTSGTIQTGTYQGVALTGGTGTGAQATVISSAGGISTATTIVQPTGGTYKFIQGSVSSGTFTPGETIRQATTLATAVYVGPQTGALQITTSSITGTPNGTNVWTGLSSGATFTPTAAPSFVLNGTTTNVALTGSTGVGALATVVVSAGNVTGVTITTPGSGYTIGEVVSYASTTTGSGGTVTITAITNAVVGVYITNPGLGYVVNDILTYNANGLGFGNGGTIKVTTVSTGTPAGLILGTSTLTQPTSDFVQNGTYSNFSFTGGTGTGAVGTITIANGTVTGVTITNPGTGYVASDVIGFTGSGATVGLGSGGTVVVSTVTYTPWVLTRTPDACFSRQVQGLSVWVTGGSTQSNTAWTQNIQTVTFDTTALAFVELVV